MVLAFIQAIRPHQWVKNILLFVPLFTALQFTNAALLGKAALAFGVFCLCASGIYLINDLLDLEADRRHPTKKQRPFAAGKLSPITGVIAAPLLLLTGISVATFFLPMMFLWTLLTYIFLSLLYSGYLKQLVFIDVVLLALLYALRVVAGATATHILLSKWLLAFSVFLFLSLAMMKRVSELYLLREQAGLKITGRGYFVVDLEQVASLGSASGYIAVLVFALYISSADILKLYTHPGILWLICPLLLYWIGRAWLLSHRGQMPDDPIIFALKDKISYLTGLTIIALVLMAK